jgi:hypothetical protein
LPVVLAGGDVNAVAPVVANNDPPKQINGALSCSKSDTSVCGLSQYCMWTESNTGYTYHTAAYDFTSHSWQSLYSGTKTSTPNKCMDCPTVNQFTRTFQLKKQNQELLASTTNVFRYDYYDYIGVSCASGYAKCGAHVAWPHLSQYCRICTAGTYSLNGFTCLECEKNTYALQGQGQCQACKEGKYTDGPKSSACIDCAVGKYRGSDMGACEECVGQWSCAGAGECSTTPRRLRDDDTCVSCAEMLRECKDGEFLSGCGYYSDGECTTCSARGSCGPGHQWE